MGSRYGSWIALVALLMWGAVGCSASSVEGDESETSGAARTSIEFRCAEIGPIWAVKYEAKRRSVGGWIRDDEKVFSPIQVRYPPQIGVSASLGLEDLEDRDASAQHVSVITQAMQNVSTPTDIEREFILPDAISEDTKSVNVAYRFGDVGQEGWKIDPTSKFSEIECARVASSS